MYLLTIEIYITYQTGFSFHRLGHAQGCDLGVPLGVGGPTIFFFRNSTRLGLLVTYMNCTCTGVTVYLAPLDILPPTLVIFTPGGQAVQAGLSCPPPTHVKIYVCYFVIFLYHFNEFRSYTSLKVRNWCLWG